MLTEFCSESVGEGVGSVIGNMFEHRTERETQRNMSGPSDELVGNICDTLEFVGGRRRSTG